MTSFVRQIIGFSRWTGAEDLRRKSAVGAQITMLNEIGRAMSTSMVSLEKTLELITEAVCVVLGVERAYLFLLDERTGDLVPRAGRGLVGAKTLDGIRVPRTSDATLARALTATAVLRGRVEEEKGLERATDESLGLGHAHSRRALLAGGLAYSVGVVLSFVALALRD